MAVSGRVACWVVNYIKMHFFWFFFSYLYISLNILLCFETMETEVPGFYLLCTIHYFIYFRCVCFLRLIFSLFSISFPVRITPSFWSLPWLSPKSVQSYNIPFFSKGDLCCMLYSEQGYASDYNMYVFDVTPWPVSYGIQHVRLYLWLLLHTEHSSISFDTACLKLVLCTVSYSSRCWISLAIALFIHVTEVPLKLLTNLPFPKCFFDSWWLWHITVLHLSLFLPLSLIWVNILKTTGLSIGPGSTLLLTFCHYKPQPFNLTLWFSCSTEILIHDSQLPFSLSIIFLSPVAPGMEPCQKPFGNLKKLCQPAVLL